MDSQVLSLIREIDPPHPSDEPMAARFLLVQGDKVFGVAERPTQLPFMDVVLSKPWKVMIGTINEFGQAEIIGTAAEAYPDTDPSRNCWRISSPLDGYGRLVGSAGTMTSIICDRLRVLYGNGCYDDVLKLPPHITIQAVNPYDE